MALRDEYSMFCSRCLDSTPVALECAQTYILASLKGRGAAACVMICYPHVEAYSDTS